MLRLPRAVAVLAIIGATALAVGCSSGSSPAGAGSSPGATSSSFAGTRVQGGDLVIARTADSQSMDLTNVFDNESIWVFEQIYQMLYTASPDGKTLMPQLATADTF